MPPNCTEEKKKIILVQHCNNVVEKQQSTIHTTVTLYIFVFLYSCGQCDKYGPLNQLAA